MADKLLHQDIEKLYIQPPYCGLDDRSRYPVQPTSYRNSFKKDYKLSAGIPYNIQIKPNPRDGRDVIQLEYKYNPTIGQWYSNTGDNSNMGGNGNQDKNIKQYLETRPKREFARPLATNGTNQLDIVFNEKCNQSTFNFTRYAKTGMADRNRYYNPLYIHDISQETLDLQRTYMDSLIDNNMNLYSSVFQDMAALSIDPNPE
jgi:hypothetical protein